MSSVKNHVTITQSNLSGKYKQPSNNPSRMRQETSTEHMKCKITFSTDIHPNIDFKAGFQAGDIIASYL